MSYDPGYGQQPGHQSSPYAPDPSPVPDVSQPLGGYPPAPPPAAPPPHLAAPSPMPGAPFAGPPTSGPPMPGPPGAPAPPPFGIPAPASAYPGIGVPERGARPGTVTAAVALTFAGAALAFVGTVLFHLFWKGWMAAEAAGADLETTEALGGAAGAITFFAAGMNLIAAAGAAVCGIFTMRGSNGARVTLCVLAGLYAAWKLTCGGFWMLAGIGASEDPQTPAIRDDVPFLYGAVGIDFLLMLLGIAIMVLLLVGPSSRYFRPVAVKGPPGY